MIENLEIDFTDKQITAFGGMSLLFKMLYKCHFKEELSALPLPEQGSNRGWDPEVLIHGLFTGVWGGASCYSHLDVVRFDPVLCKLMGYGQGPDHRAYQRYFNKFSQATNQRVFDALYGWFFSRLCFDNFTLDFDSTVMERCGGQEGAAVGYNPKRPGRKSHHPLLAFVDGLRMIANYWLRPGNTSAQGNYLAFLDNTLERLSGKRVGLVRMDSGFFGGDIFDRLEEKNLPYIVACRFNNSIKIQLASQATWTDAADGLQIAESTYQAQGWEKPRRIVMVRQDTEVRPKAAGKKIKKVKNTTQLELFPDVAQLGKYRYSCFITSLSLPAKAVYDLYRGRADSENRIKEIKYDFAADKFNSRDFWATEACESFIIMAYNFISLFRHAIINSEKSYFLKTIRFMVLNIPAYLEQRGGKNILQLARTANQRQAFLGLWKKVGELEMEKAYGS